VEDVKAVLDSVIGIVEEMRKYGEKYRELSELLDVKVYSNKVQSSRIDAEIEVEDRAYKYVDFVPKPICRDSRGRKIKRIRLNCMYGACYVEFYTIDDDRIAYIEVTDLTVENLYILQCNMAIEELEKLKKIVEKRYEELEEIIGIVRELIAYAKILTQ
jgi:hypothetical protein